MKNIIFAPPGKTGYHREHGSRRKKTFHSLLVFIASLSGYLFISAASLLLASQLPGKGIQALMVQVMIGIWIPVTGILPFSLWCIRRGWKAAAAGMYGGILFLSLILAIAAVLIHDGFRL